MSNADLVVAFNEAINARDLPALAALMHEQHEFVDPAGASLEGRAACIEAWRGFFEAFPDYRNVFDEVRDGHAGAVTVRGRSVCSLPARAGPAIWHAIVRDQLVLRWQVNDPSGADVEA